METFAFYISFSLFIKVSVSLKATNDLYGQNLSILHIVCRQLKVSSCPTHIYDHWTGLCQKERTVPVASTPDGKVRIKYHNRRKRTWKEALKVCRAEGGTLAMAKTKEEEEAVIRKIFAMEKAGAWKLSYFISQKLMNEDVWIGLRDLYENDTYLWVDGSPLTYINWRSRQPQHNNGGSDENCGTLHIKKGEQGWDDWPCPTKLCFLFTH